MKTTVIVSAHRRADLIPLVLQRLHRQWVRPDQIIYTEDGIDLTIAEAIGTTAARLNLPVLHVRQTHLGARKTAALNRAVRHATGDRVLFLDQDCLPGRLWVATHRMLAAPDNCVQGWRIHVPESSVARFSRESLPVLRGLLRGELHPRHRLLPSVQTIAGVTEGFEILGCNLGVNRADLLTVGGFDETFVGWGYEDTDLVLRLANAGRRFRVAGGPALVYHLDHPLRERSGLEAVRQRCRHTREHGTIRPARGLAQPAPPRSIQKIDSTYTLVEHDD